MFHNKLRIFLATALIAVCALAVPLSTTAAATRVSFSLRSLDGVAVTSQGLRGQVVVFAFGASWLPLSRKQMQGMRQFAAQNASRGVTFYWVSVDADNPKSKNYASDDDLRAFANKCGINVPVLRDADGAVSLKFGVDQLPAFVVLDRQGETVGAPIGGLDPDGNIADQLNDPITEALARN